MQHTILSCRKPVRKASALHESPKRGVTVYLFRSNSKKLEYVIVSTTMSDVNWADNARWGFSD